MRIAVVSIFYSEGMGYTRELPAEGAGRARPRGPPDHDRLQRLRQRSRLRKTYQEFLGPNRVSPGTTTVDGYQVHRLDAKVIGGYIVSPGLDRKVREIAPDVVHSLEIASLQTYQLALLRLVRRFALFSETHQHMSVVKPFLKQTGSHASEGGVQDDAHVADVPREPGG